MIIWAVLTVVIVVVCLYKSRQTPMTKDEQEYELQVVSQRGSSFLMSTTKQSAYNGVEN